MEDFNELFEIAARVADDGDVDDAELDKVVAVIRNSEHKKDQQDVLITALYDLIQAARLANQEVA